MTDKAPLSDFNFGPGSQELTPFDVAVLLRDYADGRRKFNQIDLKNANLSDAHLPYIHLEESVLQKVDLRNAILAGGCLNHIDLSAANLSRINLIAADLIRAKLAGANLTGAFLSGANLSGANLRKSNLTDCTLAGANLSGVDFSGAILKNANMAGATLRGANLSAVDINDLDLTDLNLEGAILPANHGGATWTALRSGDSSSQGTTTTASDISQGSSDQGYPLDAFDDSYEELIQDLEESANWGEGLYANPLQSNGSSLNDVENSSVDKVFPQKSSFDPPEAMSPGKDDSATGVEFSPDSDYSPGDIATPNPAGLNPDNSPTDLDSMAVVPFYGDDSATPEGQILADPGAESSPPKPPPEDLQDIIILGAPIDAAEDDADQVDAEAPEITRFSSTAYSGQPAVDKTQVRPQPDAEDTVSAENETTAETRILPKDRQSDSYRLHQNQVIKTIQSALNRRTHFTLRRKLLEIYGKRCAITDCNILPLLDTVMIDSSGLDATDHPSNGLVLRTDLKILYNLFLIAVHPTDYRVMLSPSLRHSGYGYLEGHKIHLPKQEIYRPDRQRLQSHLDQCKWLEYGADDPTPMATPSNPAGALQQKGQGLFTQAALAIGGLVTGGLVASLIWLGLPMALGPTSSSPDAEPDPTEEAIVSTVSVDPENFVRLGLGPLVYPQGGVIVDGSAYLSVTQLQQAGLITAPPDAADMVQTNGRRFIKASYADALGLDVSWDADSRTVFLDCCANPDIEPITIAVAGQSLTENGVIIGGSAYAPMAVFSALNLAPVQVPDDYFVGVDEEFYVKVNGLKAIGFDVAWNADTRTLNLSN